MLQAFANVLKDNTFRHHKTILKHGQLGNTYGELVQGIVKYGFEAEELENISRDYLFSLIEKNSPLIVLLDPAVLYGGIEGFGHFVVVTGHEGNTIWYNDPDLDGNFNERC